MPIPVQTDSTSKTSITWANGQNVLIDTHLLKEPTLVVKDTHKAFSKFSTKSQFEQFLGQHLKCPLWASFSTPPNYYDASNRFFTYNLLPWLKVEALINEFERIALQKRIDIKSNKNVQMIYGLLNTLDDIVKMIEEILSRILQYRKG